MNPEELKKLIGESVAAAIGAAVTPLSASVDALAKKVSAIEAGAVSDNVKPHADALRKVAASMECAGIGMHAQYGHVKVLREMADQMESEAAVHRTPHAFHASAATRETTAPVTDPALKKQLDDLTASVGSVTTIVKDLQSKSFSASASPERRTISPEIRVFLDKHNLSAAADEGKLTVTQIDKALEGMPIQDRMAQKIRLQGAGLISAGTAAA